MCGIVGYIGPSDGVEIVVEGLRRLEYRGYDSAGVAVISDGEIHVRRAKGKLSVLKQQLHEDPIAGSPAIGHTRWATHGAPSEENAHPHRVDDVVIVHNGIVENFLELKDKLSKQGRHFSSDTDTELISHLIALRHKEKGLLEAVADALKEVRGSYALAVLSVKEPDRIVVARKESPLVVGIGEREVFVASDIPALLGFTNRIVVMDDDEIGVVTQEGYEGFWLRDLKSKPKEPITVNMTPAMAEKEGYKHFMLKEIFEQPQAITDTLRGRILFEEGDVYLDEEGPHRELLEGVRRVYLSACGTSLHAAMIGQYLIAKIAGVQALVVPASDFDEDLLFAEEGDLFVAITQSGETIDTLKAMRAASAKGIVTLGVCNVVASTIAREADKVLYTRAGPEISVASTKAFTSQITALTLLAVGLARAKGRMGREQARGFLERLAGLGGLVHRVLEGSEYIRGLAHKYMNYKDFLYLGRNLMYPVALEGALKLKEISYIHAEGYSAGEMKHGPIALIEESFPTVMLAPKGPWYKRTISNLQEVKARGGKVIGVITQGDELAGRLDDVIEIPQVDPLLTPAVAVVPLQLFAYHVADLKGTDVDQPRNLAKSVTVE